MPVKSKPVRVGIVGTGGMANMHAEQFLGIPGCELAAACDVDAARAEEFTSKHKIPGVFSSLKEVVDAGVCDAVSIVTPDPFHAPLSIQALKAGLHVLCEKPIALNYADAAKMVRAARAAGVVNMVNFSYRNWPCIDGAAGAVAAGELGEIRHVEAAYQQAWLVSKAWGDWKTTPAWLWRLSSAHGSKGVLGDVGVHILDFATHPAGPIREVTCRLRAFPKAPGNRIGDYKLDANDSALIQAEFTNGALGVIHTSRWIAGHPNRLFLKISGTLGTLEIDSERSTDSYRICAGGDVDTATWKEKTCRPVPTIYQKFISAIRDPKFDATPDFARGAEIQKVLDACFESDSSRAPVRVK